MDANVDRMSLVGGDIDVLLRWNWLFWMALSFFLISCSDHFWSLSCWMSLIGKAQLKTLFFFNFYCNWLPKDSLSEAKPLLKCAKREPHLSFWLLRLLFILFLIPPPVFTSLWLRRVGVGRHQMPHCLFCLFVCFWFGWSFLFGCFGCSPIVHWEGFLDRTCTNTLFFYILFVCLFSRVSQFTCWPLRGWVSTESVDGGRLLPQAILHRPSLQCPTILLYSPTSPTILVSYYPPRLWGAPSSYCVLLSSYTLSTILFFPASQPQFCPILCPADHHNFYPVIWLPSSTLS